MSGGKTSPDAHGRWRHGTATMPFWAYSDTVRQRTRTLITTLEQHHAAHTRTAEHDVVLLVMVNDNRERQLHRRWLDLTAAVSRCRRSPPPPTARCGPGPRRRSGGH
jgi:hypothetical protein